MRGKSHNDEVRAAVMASLLAGQGVSEVATHYNLAKATVSRWRSELVSSGVEQLEPKTKQELEALLIDYVCQNLKTLKAQSEIAGRADYLQKQPANELAVLHGVMADKTIRILSALEPSEIPVERESESISERVN